MEKPSILIVDDRPENLRALLQGFSGRLPSNRALQEHLKRRAQQEGSAALYAELSRLDPDSAKQLHPNDAHRIVRALEVFHTQKISQRKLWETPAEPAPFAFRVFVLSLERKILYERIDRRVEQMIAAGLIEECRRLLERGYSPALHALQTVGYREVFQFLRGEISKEEMTALIQRHSRQYAKRQWTWLRNAGGGQWLDCSGSEAVAFLARQIG